MAAIPIMNVPSTRGLGPKVFFSYSHSDAMLVDDLGAKLREAGYETWIDYQSLEPGRDWSEQLEQGIDQSDVVLLVISRRACASEYVEAESRRGLDPEFTTCPICGIVVACREFV